MMTKIFISHRRHDSGTLALLVKEKLDPFHIESFVDVEDLTDPGDFEAQIQQEIDDSIAVVVLLGSGIGESTPVKKEIEYALKQDKPIIPILQQSFAAHPQPLPDHIETVLKNNGVKIYDQDNNFVEEAIVSLARKVRAVEENVDRHAVSFSPPDATLRVLIVDDRDQFHDIIPRLFDKHHRGEAEYFSAKVEEEALKLIQEHRDTPFDVALIDINLDKMDATNRAGLEVVRDLQSQPTYVGCAIVIMTAFPDLATVPHLRDLVRDAFIDKAEMTDKKGKTFIDSVHQAIRHRRQMLFKQEDDNGAKLTLETIDNKLVRVRLEPGLRRRSGSSDDLSDLQLLAEFDNCYDLQEAKRGASLQGVGKRLYDLIANDTYRILIDSAFNRIANGRLTIEVSCEPQLFDVPFEILWYPEYASFVGRSALIYRQLSNMDAGQTDVPFGSLLENTNGTLNILLMTPDEVQSDNHIELQVVANELEAQLNLIGIEPDIEYLIGEDASYKKLKEYIKSSHIFYYAGHGFEHKVGANRPLVVWDDGELTAIELSNLTVNDLRGLWLAFLSMPLRNANETVTGVPLAQSIGTLAKQGVTVLKGYRTATEPKLRHTYAQTFFQKLVQTFSVKEASHLARQSLLPSNDCELYSPILVLRY